VLLPDDETITRRYTESVEEFARCGYQQYEISNFAICGFESRHNRQYWLLEDYLAFGPAAVGTVRGTRYKNEPDLYRYVKNLAIGKLPPQDIEEVNPSKRLLETIMLSLRLTSGLDIRHLMEVHRYDLLRHRSELVADLCLNGDLIQENGQIRLTPRGMFRSDMIAAALCPDFV
jgi:oxygen-independent coproporphyrinogen-3 oxidase